MSTDRENWERAIERAAYEQGYREGQERMRERIARGLATHRPDETPLVSEAWEALAKAIYTKLIEPAPEGKP